MTKKNPLLQNSPLGIDKGKLVGRLPDEVPLEILALRFREQKPLKAIRARCLDCCSDNASEIHKCVATDCPTWPFRMGRDPFRKKTRLSEQNRKRLADILKVARAIAKKRAEAKSRYKAMT